ncbi:MAG: hypothetical protein M1420_05530 [Actinobacteria bacterium]|nr:hypothetical protein [Actinomycetota bacterium]
MGKMTVASPRQESGSHADPGTDPTTDPSAGTSPLPARMGLPGGIAHLAKHSKDMIARHKRLATFTVATVVYLVISLWLTGLPGHNLTTTMMNESGDPNVTLFFLKWWPWAILHGHNPFVVRGLTYPATYDAAWLTSMAAPALLAAPVTLLWGPITSWNLLLLLAPVFASVSMLALLDYLDVSALPAATGGFIFGFSAFEVSEMSGHLFLILIFPIPLLVLLFMRRMNGAIRPVTFVVCSVLLAGFMLYTSTELSLDFALSALGGIVLFAIWYPRVCLEKLRALGREVALFVGGVLVLTVPLLWYLLTNLQVGGTAINSPFIFSTDLLNFVIPTPNTWLGSGLVTSISTRFTGNFAEEGGYLGIILLILTVLAVTESIKRASWAVPFSIWTLVLAVCTLGPVLHVDGTITAIRLPWDLPAHLPLLKNILPSRLMVFVALGVAVWVTLWVTWAKTRRARALRLSALLLGVVMLIPSPATFHWTRPDIPQAVSDGQIAAFARTGSGVLVLPRGPALPFSDGRLGVLWAEASGFQFNATAPPWGYNPYSKNLGFLRWPLYTISSAVAPPPGTAYQIEVFCATHHDSAVAIPSQAPAWESLLGRLDWAHRTFGGLTVFHVPSSVLRRFRTTSASETDTAFLYPQVAALQTAAACYLAHGGSLSALTPDAAIADHCLNVGYAGVSQSNNQSSNWTVESGWLGPQGQDVGIGIGSTGAVARKVFEHLQEIHVQATTTTTTGAGTQEGSTSTTTGTTHSTTTGTGLQGATKFLLYDPNPHPVTLQAMAHDPQGTYLMVLPPSALQGYYNRTGTGIGTSSPGSSSNGNLNP